jgi:TolB protein
MSMNREEWLSDIIDSAGVPDLGKEITGDPELNAMIRTVRKVQAAREYEAPSPDFAKRGWEQIAKETQVKQTQARRFHWKRMVSITAVASLLLIVALVITPFLGNPNVSASEIRVISEGQLVNLGVKQALFPQYAGSDQAISYGVEDEILLWNRASGQSNKLPLAFPYMRDASWSPDGKKAAFAGYDKASSGPSTPGIWIVNSDGTEPKLVALPADADTAFEAPVWSPEGNRIAFTATRAQLSDETGVTYERTVVVVNADGLDIQTITMGSQPSWSPDGKKLAYTVDEGTESPQIWITDLSDRTQRKLTDGQMPAWSPAEPFIAYTKLRSESRVLETDEQGLAAFSADVRYQELWAINVKSGTETQLTHSAYPEQQLNAMLAETKGRDDTHAAYAVSGETSDGQPAWSYDGKHLIFTRDINEEYGIHFALQELTIDYR